MRSSYFVRSHDLIERFVKQLGRRAGLEISHYRPFAARRASRLLAAEIDVVIDVGANVGRYGSELRGFGYADRIVSLEPLTAAFVHLADRARYDGAWECHNVAAGAQDGEATLNVASNLASSSLLPMEDEHMSGAPHVSYIGCERVTLRQLDSLLPALSGTALLKIDVQGYENEVLMGATATLSRVELIESELSIAQLYKGQPSLRAMIDCFSDLGFEMVDLDPFFYDKTDGRVLAIDALFAREA